MTSNLASDVIQKYANDTSSEEMMMAKLQKDEGKQKDAYEKIRKQMTQEVHMVLKKVFKPEFLNRVDEIIIFESLSIEEITKIVDIQIAELQKRLNSKKLTITVSKEAKEHLAKHGFDPQFGARPLKRYIQQVIENPLSLMIIEDKVKEGQNVKVDEEDGKIVINFKR